LSDRPEFSSTELRIVLYLIKSGSALKPLKRRFITLLCFIMAISLYTSVFIFIDSHSYSMWQECNDIGPVAMRVQGDDLEEVRDQIASTRYVTAVGLVKTAYAYLRMDKDDVYQGSPYDILNPVFLVQGNAYSLVDDFANSFPNEFEIVEGRYPQNSSEIAIAFPDAAYWGLTLGKMMNYSHTLNGIKRTVFIVGIFKLASDDDIRYLVTNAKAIVTSDVLNPMHTDTLAYIDINRTIVSPMNPRASLDLLYDIEDSIKSISPSGTLYSGLYVDNYLAIGIQSYIENIDFEKTRQISKLQLLFLLSGILAFLAARFNITLREDEANYQKMRGASKRRIIWFYMSELWILSFAASLCSIFVGLLLSRVGWLSPGYLEFNSSVLFGNPVLVSVDTLIIVALSGLIMPIMGYVSHITKTRSKKQDIEHRRLARLVRSLKLIRWDITLYILVSIVVWILYIGGPSIDRNPAILLIASFVPIPLFLAVASLFNKGIVFLSRHLASIFKRAIGKIPSYAGMRNISHKISLAIPTILVLAIALSSFLTSNALTASLPSTHNVQTRYLIGGDLSFKLDNDASAEWNNFSQVIYNNENVLSIAFVSMGFLSLSNGAQGAKEFIAVNPEMYSKVGYAYTGEKLDNCGQTSFLEALEANPEGVVLTEDIASEYNLIPGDTLRVFSVAGESLTVEFNIVGITDEIPRPRIIGEPSSDSIVGAGKVWLNRNYIGGLIDLNATTENYLCVRTSDGCNTTEIGEEALAEYGAVILDSDQWSSLTAEMTAFQSGIEYSFDRAIDSLIAAGMILCVLVIFALFQIDRQNSSKEDRTILRTLGASRSLQLKIRLGEVLALILLSFLLVLFVSPINVACILHLGLQEYSTWTYTFPIAVFVSVNWINFIGASTLILILSVVFILALAINYHYSCIANDLGELETDLLINKNREAG
jgi:hypothetical protein